MSSKTKAQPDRAPEIVPPIVACNPEDVQTVQVTAPFTLHVTFFDGLTGTVDMTLLVHSPDAGVFSALADPTLFAQAFVLYGAVSWPGDLDLAPDAMYDEIKAKGHWILR